MEHRRKDIENQSDAGVESTCLRVKDLRSTILSYKHGRNDQQTGKNRNHQVKRRDIGRRRNKILFLIKIGAIGDQCTHSERQREKCLAQRDRKSTRLNSSHVAISYA